MPVNKHVVLGLIFLKYISDKFETKFNALVEGAGFEEDRDGYEAEYLLGSQRNRWLLSKNNAKRLQRMDSILMNTFG